MALAGHPLTFSVSSDDSAYSEVDGINDHNFDYMRELLDTTDFKDTSGGRTRMAGLTDGSIEISGDYEASDTGQALIRTQFASGSVLYSKMLWNGSAGHKVACIVEKWTNKVTVDGKVEFSASIKFNGAVSTV